MISHEELKPRILEHLTRSPMHIDDIVDLVGEPVAVVSTTLAMMELCAEVASDRRMSYTLPKKEEI